MAKVNIKMARFRDVIFGDNITVVEPVNLYECTIGDNCFIGPFVEIQCNVKIGANCRIQSHSFICEGVVIGDDCFISHGAMFLNDKASSGQRAHGDKRFWGRTTIGNNVIIGSNATILPVKIADDVVVGAGSVVTKNINAAGKYAGNPARKLP